jgi:hypothetical protein
MFLLLVYKSTLRGLSIAMICGQSAIDCFFGAWGFVWTFEGARTKVHWGGEESCQWQGFAVTLSAMMTITNFVSVQSLFAGNT